MKFMLALCDKGILQSLLFMTDGKRNTTLNSTIRKDIVVPHPTD
jgi:hypothetical protein